ncbi:hypothetical protein HIM_04481 [Hirsutella minnesotensis 3608]|uniref:Cytochrome P450 n=1 Tax=Hirsutella minnesotensis 3608 TaxID=1043627 RepID=A0A0F7ZPS8_9HYPO|nr:hypothetical protein HIM_04481 [Hirsutella minnesotensis 3608]
MLLSSPVYVLVASCPLLLVLLVRRLSSPLRRVPGPTYSLVTSFILKYHELRAGRTAYIHRLHQHYGPVVRIAPKEVSFTSWSAIKEIYCSGGSGYDKTSFYDLFKIYGRRTMFTMLNKTDHARRKRLLADRYANTSIMHSATMQGIQERAQAFIRRCTSASGSRTSEAFRADEDMMHQITADDSLQNRLISQYSPTLHRAFASLLALFVKPREVPLADEYVTGASKRTDVASFALVNRLWEKNVELDSTDVAAECLDHMVAGIDTTGDSLCFLLWELSQPRSRSHQVRLTEELRSNPEAPLEQLPFLDAVVCETLRCYPAIPMSLPRLVPSGGRIVDGTWLPEGTIVSCQAYSVQRINQEVFPRPETYDPCRWLELEGDVDRRRLLFAFASGGRGCVGKHLALAEMKTLLRDVYSNFSTTPDPSMTENSMAMSDQLISTRPKGQRCLIQFHPLDNQNVRVGGEARA